MSLDDQLAEMWAAGASFTDMGRKLGVSRSIVAGRIDRARKSGDPRFAPRPPESRAEPPKVRIIKPAGESVGNVRAPELSSKPRTAFAASSQSCGSIHLGNASGGLTRQEQNRNIGRWTTASPSVPS
jgi:hypothetical protein